MKKIVSAALVLLMAVGLLCACGAQQTPTSTAPSGTTSGAPSSSQNPQEQQTARIAGLKGPTTMGMVGLMNLSEKGETNFDYQVEMFGAADEINTRLIQGELDIAALPANIASVLYNKTGGEIQVAAINTLGVLYVVENGQAVNSVEDLQGKTIYSTGKGATPELALDYILTQNGLEPGVDVTIEYKSEATEIAALLAADSEVIAVLPQPYVTVVQMKNENIRVALSLSEEWDKVSPESAMVTGVLVVRSEFAKENPDLVADFLQEYEKSIKFVQENPELAAQLIVKYGIIENEVVAEKAIPACNIVYIDSTEMQEKLAGYLDVLFLQNPDSIGGQLPSEDFYYIP